MRRSLDDARRPYQELTFPDWVRVTACKTYSRTHLIPGRHGVVREIVRWEND